MILAFDEAGCQDLALVGGKGASLARMAGHGLPVPPGFVVCAPTLERVLAEAGADGRLRARLAEVRDDADLPEAATAAYEIVEGCEYAAAERDAVAAAYARLGADEPVAVRSSAVAEDSETASFAGQQETYLHVRGADQVVGRIRDCWASFFTERALYYRRHKGSLEDLRMAVVVQRMVEPDVAGVLFTVDPVRGRKDQMLVEAVFGLGEAAVSGSVTPDHYVIARDGRLKRLALTVQPYAVVRGPDGGTGEQVLTPEQGGARTLSDDALRRLAALGRDLQERFGGPQDIEWALQGDDLFLLQSRPVTTT